MPNSLKCKIKHLCHNGTINERERDRILEALEQESVLDKIRDEIEKKARPNEIGGRGNGKSVRYGLGLALAIIDKHRAESENNK